MLTEAGPCSRFRMPWEGRAAAAARTSCWQISASVRAARRGQAARMNRKSAYGSLAARTACGSGTPWPASRSRSRPVTAVTGRSQIGPRNGAVGARSQPAHSPRRENAQGTRPSRASFIRQAACPGQRAAARYPGCWQQRCHEPDQAVEFPERPWCALWRGAVVSAAGTCPPGQNGQSGGGSDSMAETRRWLRSYGSSSDSLAQDVAFPITPSPQMILIARFGTLKA